MLLGQVTVGAWLSVTVTVKLQVAEFPAPSVARYVTAVPPTGKLEPEARPPISAGLTPSQLSLAEGAAYETAREQVLAAADWVLPDGHEIEGATLSVTETVNEHELVREEESVAMYVTVEDPLPKDDPGPLAVCRLTEAEPQLSVAVGVVQDTVAAHVPEAVKAEIVPGQLENDGTCASLTVTVKEQDPEFELESLVAYVTVVLPRLKLEPGASPAVREGTEAPQLSEAGGGVQLTEL